MRRGSALIIITMCLLLWLMPSAQGQQVPDSQRIGGANRYATAAAVAQQYWPDGADTVYLSTGVKFPDALAGGPVAAQDSAPLLLVKKDSIPRETRGELVRLAPNRVVAIGGTGVLSEEVLSEVADVLDGARVSRISGVDRYDTAATLALEAFPDADTVLLAYGENYPDALAGAAAAAYYGWPVLLSDSHQLSPFTAAALETMQPRRIYALGGSGPLGIDPVGQAAIAADTEEIYRLGGADRFETASIIATTLFDQVDAAYLSTGRNFPDALAAAAAARRSGAPLLLSEPTCAPSATVDAVAALGADELIVLGSDVVVGQAATRLVPCVVKAPTAPAEPQPVEGTAPLPPPPGPRIPPSASVPEPDPSDPNPTCTADEFFSGYKSWQVMKKDIFGTIGEIRIEVSMCAKEATQDWPAPTMRTFPHRQWGIGNGFSFDPGDAVTMTREDLGQDYVEWSAILSVHRTIQYDPFMVPAQEDRLKVRLRIGREGQITKGGGVIERIHRTTLFPANVRYVEAPWQRTD